MSEQMKKLIRDLQGNLEVVGDFFDNPQKVIERYRLSGHEKNLVLSRSMDALETISLNADFSPSTPSGAHSRQCGALLNQQ